MRRFAINTAGHLALLAALGMPGAIALGEDFVESAPVDLASRVARLIAQPIPEDFRVEFDGWITATSTVAGFAGDLDVPVFARLEQTDGALDRLISARRLELLTIMRSESTAVFFGVNEKGRLGVHFDASPLLDPDH